MASTISWLDSAGDQHSANLCTGALTPRAPTRIVMADDTTSADTAYRLACEGTGLLWQGDFQNARQLLSAITRRIDTKKVKRKTPPPLPMGDPAAFHAYRLAQASRARILSMLLIPMDAQYEISLRRAPDVQQACLDAFGAAEGPQLISLRELLGVVGAEQWREKGVSVPLLGDDAKIYPFYGVFSPTRGEYLTLVAEAPLKARTAWDIGTGTGVLAAILAKRGVQQVVATEISEQAAACASFNIEQLGLTKRVSILHADLFPKGRADLILCNPPWLPARPTSTLEYALYDPDSNLLTRFVSGLAEHLNPDGEGWLIMSDLAVHLGLRDAQMLPDLIAASGLRVIDRVERAPEHGKVSDREDPLHAARVRERTSLWRLALK